MKGNKRLYALIAALLMILIAVSVAYSLYFRMNVKPIDVSTSITDTAVSELITASNKMPGEKILLNDTGLAKISNKGSKSCILQISFEDSAKGILPKDPPKQFTNDYYFENGIWYFGDKRLDEVMRINMSLDNNNKWVKINDSYYAMLKPNSIIPLSEIYLELISEFGGNHEEHGSKSELRNFELDSIFEIQYKVVAIQAKREIVRENLGENISNSVPSEWYH